MVHLPKHISEKLALRKAKGTFRSLPQPATGIDFFSNNYLGLTDIEPEDWITAKNYASGSRLLSGNSEDHIQLEIQAQNEWLSPCLLFNSGYNANLAIFQAIPQKNHIVLYDSNVHASIREGLRLSLAKSWSYPHQDLEILEQKLQKAKEEAEDVYVVTESLFSMDGSITDLANVLRLCKTYGSYLILDEAHAVGVTGENGLGLSYKYVDHSNLLITCFPMGKAFAAMGCIVRCPQEIKDYLINYSSAFIYTTALPPNYAKFLSCRINQVISAEQERLQIYALIKTWCSKVRGSKYTKNLGPVQFVQVPRKKLSKVKIGLTEGGFQILPVRYPTVAEDKEGFRIILHAHNTEAEVISLINLLEWLC